MWARGPMALYIAGILAGQLIESWLVLRNVSNLFLNFYYYPTCLFSLTVLHLVTSCALMAEDPGDLGLKPIYITLGELSF